MKVKRYVVDTLPDALNKIRQELGKDAVILNTKQLKVGGILGLFSKKKIEVIAAADEQPAPTEKLPIKPIVALEQDVPTPTVGSTVAAQAYRRSAPYSVVPEKETKPKLVAVANEPQPVTRQQADVTSASQQDPQLDVVQQFKHAAALSIQRAASKQPEPASSEPTQASDTLDTQQLMAEIKEMKELVVKLTGGATSNDVAYPTHAFATIEQRLVKQGILPAVAEDLVQRAMEARDMSPSNVTDQEARALVKEQMLQLFGAHQVSGISDTSRIIQFVGPTGVGKTTTIAKLAAEQVLKHNRQVGFITTDTYRIAAIDQLKTYATILNVPVEVVFSSEEMEDALGNLSDRQLIFMDTAGRNYRDEKSVQELHELIQSHGQSETYLVLSLVSKYEDIQAIIDNFKHVQVDKVLWTKMDETVSLGAIVNVLHQYSIPASYITNGQNVPDDISLLHPETIIQQLLGEDAYG